MVGQWVRNERQYGTGEIYMMGRIEVGSVFMPSRSKGDDPFWRAAITLPGLAMKKETVDHADMEAAKQRVEKAVATWFKWLEG